MKTLFFLLAVVFFTSCAKEYENDVEMNVDLMIIPMPSLFSDQIKLSLAKGWENLFGSLLMVNDVWPFLLLGIGTWFEYRNFSK